MKKILLLKIVAVITMLFSGSVFAEGIKVPNIAKEKIEVKDLEQNFRLGGVTSNESAGEACAEDGEIKEAAKSTNCGDCTNGIKTCCAMYCDLICTEGKWKNLNSCDADEDDCQEQSCAGTTQTDVMVP